jgi:diadenosine tetraphosphatase ApaH/serine/threonine PP2A family protein phosphatase
MRYFILSDVHGNLDALEAVLADVPRAEYDRLLVLGDLVGYGAQPNEVVDRIRALEPDVIIRGNHDKVAVGLDDAEGFNLVAREAVEWTAGTLTDANRAYLTALPAGPLFVDEDIEVCHGSPHDEDAYIFESLDALRGLKLLARPVGFFGHTHVPIVFTLSDDTFDLVAPDPAARESVLELRPDVRYLINPGSVGQPRDGDPRAAYALYDHGARQLRMRRVPYLVEAAQVRIRQAGLPEGLAKRLALGR